MTEGDLDQLYRRILAGEQPTDELWALRKSDLQDNIKEDTAEALADLWNLVFHREGVFPKLEAAKAVVETALAANTSYPISINDGLVYDALSTAERHELVQFIRDRVGKVDAPGGAQVLNDFAHDLLGGGPQV